MKQTCIQFHALNSEILNFIKEIARKNDLKVYGVTYFPHYAAKELFVEERETRVNSELIIVCRSEIEISDKKLYNEYLNGKCGDLIIQLGRDDGVELKESSMGVISNGDIDVLWKRTISKFRKELLRGAYVVTPSGYQKYYPRHGIHWGQRWLTKEALPSNLWRDGICID